MSWLGYALVGAAAAAATAILGKLGVAGVPSNLAVGIRTSVVLIMVTGLVVFRGEHAALRAVRAESWIFLILSGLATGVSWLAYYKALQVGAATSVAPVDKLSLPLTVLLAALVLGEPLNARVLLGVGLMTAGAMVIALKPG